VQAQNRQWLALTRVGRRGWCCACCVVLIQVCLHADVGGASTLVWVTYKRQHSTLAALRSNVGCATTRMSVIV
jgi:hypothetical protein